MNFYNIMLFLHIGGVLAMFFSHGVIHYGVRLMRQAQTSEQLRERGGMTMSSKILLPLSNLLIIISALYMVFYAWNWTTAWINISLIALLLMIPIGHVIIGRRVDAILKAANAAPEGSLSEALHIQRNDTLLWVAVCESTAMNVGIVFLMVVKPDLVVSLVTMFVALVVGLLSSVRTRHEQELPEKILIESAAD